MAEQVLGSVEEIGEPSARDDPTSSSLPDPTTAWLADPTAASLVDPTTALLRVDTTTASRYVDSPADPTTASQPASALDPTTASQPASPVDPITASQPASPVDPKLSSASPMSARGATSRHESVDVGTHHRNKVIVSRRCLGEPNDSGDGVFDDLADLEEERRPSGDEDLLDRGRGVRLHFPLDSP
ncbi:unnamed protein product [Arabis nemorensis]|uniref:Uncharacterized protein n=1 Tax=Arabis nemorensis TaxID=586526 RepID=A0A565C779_9BRAS|nr:unnamed protein product [Arabis nemorensis]